MFHGQHGVVELREVQVFVAMNLLWYAREGHPEERAAPDVFLAFGRPKGDRGSYKQWEEADVPPQVVIEVRSPGNSDDEMARKHLFYEEHGVEDYFFYDPDSNHLQIFRRKGSVLVRQNFTVNYTDPRLGIRFDLSGEEMQVFYPDGRRFLTFEEVEADRTHKALLLVAAEQKLHSTAANLQKASDRATAAEQKLQSTAEELQTTKQHATATEQKLHITVEELQAIKERATATEQKLHTTAEELQTIKERAARLEQRAARVAEPSRKLLLQQATAEEIVELQQLLQPPPS